MKRHRLTLLTLAITGVVGITLIPGAGGADPGRGGGGGKPSTTTTTKVKGGKSTTTTTTTPPCEVDCASK